MFSSSQDVTFQKACKREGPLRSRQAKREAHSDMFKKHVNVKLREATAKGSVKVFLPRTKFSRFSRSKSQRGFKK